MAHIDVLATARKRLTHCNQTVGGKPKQAVYYQETGHPNEQKQFSHLTIFSQNPGFCTSKSETGPGMAVSSTTESGTGMTVSLHLPFCSS